MLDIWENKLFVQPTVAEGLPTLFAYIEKTRFKPQLCLRAAVTIAKCLCFLHKREFTHSNLTSKDVFVKRTANVSIISVKDSCIVELYFQERGCWN